VKVITAAILAGGLGTRLRSAVGNVPKPMAPIAGRPFLECLLDYWIAQGVRRFVLSVGYRREVIVNHFGSTYRGARLHYAIEEMPLGTGGGFLLALDRIAGDSPMLLLNGDTYFAVDLETLTAFAAANDADWCFALFGTHDRDRYMGIGLAPGGRIASLQSSVDPMRPSTTLANGGVYWIHPRAVRDMPFPRDVPLSLEADLLPALLASGRRMYGLECPGTFIDIGLPADYRRAQTLLSPAKGAEHGNC
jgi:D-glycero-alpha-D-manno-heptose 1-phosphate guanylyltransferase